MSLQIIPVGREGIPPWKMSSRFFHEVTYFISLPGENGAPEHLPEREYWISKDDAQNVYDEGVVRLVSPLDSDSTAELELTEEQEAWLEWMIKHEIQHIRLSPT